MKAYAVGHIDFYNNDLKIEIVLANSWYEAVKLHSKIRDNMDGLNFDTLQACKNLAFDMGMMIDVVEIGISCP